MKNRQIWTNEHGFWHRTPVETPELTEDRYKLSSASRKSEQKAAAFHREGWDIYDGNNPDMPLAKKWENHYVVCIRSTNSTRHGHCINTTFAVKHAKVAHSHHASPHGLV